MADLVVAHLSEIFSFFAGLAGGSFLTLKITKRKSASGNGRFVDQSGATAHGDVVGGNKSTTK